VNANGISYDLRVADARSRAPDVDDEIVRAAGGVASRRRDGRIEVLLVHRPEYDDWSFPKGKSVAGESDEECALREVEEETNLRVTLGAELASTTYASTKGRPKRVRYWLVVPQNPNEARPQNEVDALAWLTPGDAAERLTYPRDREVLRSFLAHA
jgi:8-oxo-dGTP pyrophosphatase MutT (NUDIX family)